MKTKIKGSDDTEKNVKNRSWNKKLKDNNDIFICNGVAIDKSVYDIKENRVFTLLIKGLITYCLTMGGAGLYLSGFEIEYNELLVNLVALSSALLCSLLYYNHLTENVGYLLYFVGFALGAYLLKDYINSGFYAIVNDTMEAASMYLKMDGMQHYNERISDRYTAITISMVFFVLLINILINNYISRRARYLIATIIVLFVSIIPLYFESEPDTFYAVLMLGGIVMAYLLRGSRHYRLYRRKSVYFHDKDGLNYGMNHKALRQVLLIGFIFVFLAVNIIGMVVPKKTYDMQGNNKYKKASMEMVTNFFTLGLEGLFNFYANRGGLSTGRLGGVSSIKLDYETDIRVEYTPYSYETLYLKQFVGNTYNPYVNSWTMDRNFRSPEGENHQTVETLKKRFEDGEPYSAKGRLKVTNVDVSGSLFLPYYSDDTNNIVYFGATEEYIYYPYLTGDVIGSEEEVIKDECYYIPYENYNVIEDFCLSNDINGDTPEEIIDKVCDYFQENIPYTIRPGATPRNRDFVNYFLTKNKKGYCAQFASSTALILRYFGIPTRYCEGYALSYDHATHYGELVDGAEYSDYYQGYSAIGETALISVDITDAEAHAWVEAYIDGKGWVIVEATPAGDTDEIDEFWNQFSRGSSDDEEDTEEASSGSRFRINDSFMKGTALVVVIVIAAGILVFLFIMLLPTIKYLIAYVRADKNDRLILKYMRFIKKKKKKDDDFKDKMNYEDQLDYLRKSGKMTCTDDDAVRLGEILNKAGFSKNKITEEEYDFAEKILYKS